jgi:hypothetical protein
MEIRNNGDVSNMELPLQLHISFKKVFEVFQKYADESLKTHPFHQSSKVMVSEIKKYPELIDGFSDFSLLQKHQEVISLLLDALFPEILSSNEIKAATIPFSFTSFKFTDRFKDILENAGEDYELKVRNLEDDLMYIFACTLILASVYHYPVDLKRPFYFDIPDKKTETIKHYRIAFNGDFIEIFPSENAPKITLEDIKLLLDNFDDISIWKEKFPPNSYIFKGFSIMNLFDVTPDETLTAIRVNLIQKDDGSIVGKLSTNLSNFYGIPDLKVGYSEFDISNIKNEEPRLKQIESILIHDKKTITSKSLFCDVIITKLFIENKDIVISDVEKYGLESNKDHFYEHLKESNIGSIILIPIKSSNNKNLVLLEIGSPRAYELNSVNKQKMKDIIPVFEAAVERNSEEFLNALEATIQEHYTSIHPSVKWRFYEAAENYQTKLFIEEENGAFMKQQKNTKKHYIQNKKTLKLKKLYLMRYILCMVK